MSVVVVLPSIYAPFTRSCLLSSQIPAADVMVVDNTVENRGVAASWNLGRDRLLAEQKDWLVILSASIRFGPAGGLDFLHHLRYAPDDNPHGIPVIEAGGGLGWHLIGFHRTLLEKVGPFDPIFYPAYFEDNDMSVRIQRAYGVDTKAAGFAGPLWPKVPVDATLAEVAHGIKHGGVQVDMAALKAYFMRKWGPDEAYRTPFNDPTLDWTYVGPESLGVLAC